jgi:hypothetical protein
MSLKQHQQNSAQPRNHLIRSLYAALFLLLAPVQAYAAPNIEQTFPAASNLVTNGSVLASASYGLHTGEETGHGVMMDVESALIDPRFPKVEKLDGSGVPVPSPNEGRINAIIEDGLGGWVIGGDFTHVGGVELHNLAYVQADLSVSTAWRPNPNGIVHALKFHTREVGLRLLVGGEFTKIHGELRSYFAELHTGSISKPVTTVDLAINGIVRAITTADADDEVEDRIVYIGGDFTTVQGTGPRDGDGDGVLDIDVGTTVFGGSGSVVVNVDMDGNGSFETPLEVAADGQFDVDVDGDGDIDIDVTADGIVDKDIDVDYLGADAPLIYTNYPAAARERIAALNLNEASNGMIVREWNPNVDGRVNVLELAAVRGRLYVGGNFNNIAIGVPTTGTGGGDDVGRKSIAELNVSNNLNVLTTWNPGGADTTEIKTMLLQEFTIDEETGDATGLLYVGGDFTKIGNQNRSNFAVLDISLATNNATAWNVSFNDTVNALAQTSDAVYVGGAFTEVDGETGFDNLARIQTADRTLHTSWNPVVNGEVTALAIGDDTLYAGGKFTTVGDESRLYIGGDFTYIGPSTGSGVLVEPSPSVGAVVGGDPYPNMIDGDVYVAISDGSITNAGWYIGGSFSSVGSIARNNVAHIDNTGAVTAWNPNADGAVRALALGAAGVYAGGDFTTIGGETRNNIALINAATGAADGTWDPNANGVVRALTLGAAGVYVGGDFTTIGGQARNNIALINTGAGAADVTWNPDANGIVRALELAVSGTDVYVGGDFTNIDGQAKNYIALIDNAGLATTWDPNANGIVRALEVSGTDVYVGGDFTNIGGQAKNYIALIDNAAVATGWNPNANGSVAAIFLDSGFVYVGGDFTLIGSLWRNRVASFSVNISDATAWNPGVGNTVHAIDRDPGAGNVFIGGAFASVGGATRERLAAIDSSSGKLNANFNVGTDAAVRDILLSADGTTIFVAGDFTSVGGQSRNHLAALNTTSGSAWTWNPDVDGSALGTTIHDIELSPGEDLFYVAGLFETIGGVTRNNIGAINVISGAASEWNPSVDGTVYSLALRGSEIFIGGEFQNVNTNSQNVVRSYLAGLSTTLMIDNALQWAPAVDAPVRAMALAGTTLYVGGDFRNINDSGFTKTRDYLAAIDTSANAFNVLNWAPSANDSVYSLALTDDAIFVGGDFTTINSLPRERLAALDFVDGVPLPWWDLRADATVRHLGIGSADDRMVIAGDFRKITTTASMAPLLTEHLRQGLTVVDVGFPYVVTNPPAGAFNSAPVLNVKFSCIDLPRDCSETVYYTVNSNVAPTVAGPPAPPQDIDISVNTSLQFITVDEAGNQSELQSMLYVIDTLPPTTTASPTGSLPDGEVLNGDEENVITLDCVDVGGAGCAEIYYTIDGTTPTDASLVYTAPIALSQNTTLKYFAFDQARNSEELIGIKEEQYWLDLAAPIVVADPPTQIFYEDNLSLTLLCSDDPEVTATSISDIPDASNPPLPTDPPVTGEASIDENDRFVTGCKGVYYTLDNSTPTQASTLYTGPIQISASTVVKFIAVDHANNEGRVQRASYVKNYSGNVGAFGPLAGGLLLLPLLAWRFGRRHCLATQGYRDRGLV